MAGHGPATIQEVSFATKYQTAAEQDNSAKERADLQTKLNELRRHRDVLQTKKHRLKKQRDVLDGFADNVMQAGGKNSQVRYIYSWFNPSNPLNTISGTSPKIKDNVSIF